MAALEPTVPGLPERSVLFVSMVTHPSHPLHETVRKGVHPPPDLDLGRYVHSVGPGLRRYFAEQVVDGALGPLPTDLGAYRGVVMGCTLHYMNPARAPIAPWQEELVRFVRQVVDQGVPFFGCCGGALIGQVALGGKLSPNPKGPGLDPGAEGSIVIRTTQISLTEAGRADPLFQGAPPTLPVHSVHSDHAAALPEGCRSLAHSADIPNLAVAYGDRVRLLFGMHPEMSDALMRQVAGAIIRTGRFGTNPDNQEGMMSAVANMRPTEYANKHLLLNFLKEFCAARS